MVFRPAYLKLHGFNSSEAAVYGKRCTRFGSNGKPHSKADLLKKQKLKTVQESYEATWIETECVWIFWTLIHEEVLL